jgi:hypothetical protein
MLSNIFRLSIKTFLSAVIVLQVGVSHAGRVALVVGNSAYASRPLDNPVNDARAVARKLQALGFRVVKRENLRIREIGATLRDFRSQIKAGDEVVFFYAGHGLQVNGANYLPAVDAEIQGEEDVPLNSLNLASVLSMLEESKAGVKLLFLDACRDNPYTRSFRSAAGSDLGKVGSAPSGTLIHYATRPGSVAADGKKGGNGLYTEHLLQWLSSPNIPIEAMHKRVAVGVESASRGVQEPWSEGQLKGEFYFVKTTTAASVASPAANAQTGMTQGSTTEVVFWNSVKDSDSPEELQAYLTQYPNGTFAELARVRLARLQPKQVAPAPIAVPLPATAAATQNGTKVSPKSVQPDPGLILFQNILNQVMKQANE